MNEPNTVFTNITDSVKRVVQSQGLLTVTIGETEFKFVPLPIHEKTKSDLVAATAYAGTLKNRIRAVKDIVN